MPSTVGNVFHWTWPDSHITGITAVLSKARSRSVPGYVDEFGLRSK